MSYRILNRAVFKRATSGRMISCIKNADLKSTGIRVVGIKSVAKAALILIVCCACMANKSCLVRSYAAVSGNGTGSSPYTGTAEIGDIFEPNCFLKNITLKDNALILLERLYEAKSFDVAVSLGQDISGDSSIEKIISIKYGDNIREKLKENMIDDPVAKGKTFSGWYLRGNHKLLSGSGTQTDIFIAGDHGDTVIGEETRYLIDTDDSEDSMYADIDAEGRTVLRALWQEQDPQIEDGYEAEDGTAGENTSGLDPWDEDKASNKAIEYIDGLDTREKYKSKHGSTKYQYGRIALNADTDMAKSYSWYIRKAGESVYRKFLENKDRCVLQKLDRRYNGAQIKCIAVIGDELDSNGEYVYADLEKAEGTDAYTEEELDKLTENGDSVIYETSLTVFYLPQIEGTRISVDGEEVTLG